jgi:UDP:flavonoid glycosyltransferase YjiC (YdhE family)
MLMHIAFFAAPSPGHVYPTLGIVAELTRRGHRVSYSITERLQEAVVEAGAHPVLRELGLKARSDDDIQESHRQRFRRLHGWATGSA